MFFLNGFINIGWKFWIFIILLDILRGKKIVVWNNIFIVNLNIDLFFICGFENKIYFWKDKDKDE